MARKASQLIGTLEQKDLWREILTEDDADSDKKNEIQVYIGSETGAVDEGLAALMPIMNWGTGLRER